MQDQKDTPAIAQQVALLSESAAELARRGQNDDAAKVYQQINKIAPYHIAALDFLAIHARRMGDYELSLQLLERLLQADPQRAGTYMHMGITHKRRGDHQTALQAFDKALELQPVYPHVLLLKGASLEELGREPEAVRMYFLAFTQAPALRQPDRLAQTSPNLQKLVARADELIVQTTVKLLDTALAPIRAGGGVETQRTMELLEIYTGRRPPQYQHVLQRPSYMYFPGLEPQSFFEREEFDWCAQLEGSTAAIRAELLEVLQTPDVLKPYVEVSVPDAAEWTTLNRSLQWSSFHLYKDGQRVEENCRRCPATLEAIERLPLTRIPGHSPEVFFSILRPGTHIPPHYGLANYKVAVHLPLIVPPDCSIRVGNETRGWTEGQCLIFDDSFRHEAWNNSTEPRAVLILDVWNPGLSERERSVVTTVLEVNQELQREYAAG